jgi:hypothetical protein
MNFSNIIEEIEKADEEIYEKINPRRKIIKNFLGAGTKIALTAVPIALGGLFTKAYGKVPDKVLDVLNFALSLEHLENRFYQTAMDTPNLIPEKDKIGIIRDHERAHVKFLQDTITSSGGIPVAEAKYDFTGKGVFPDVFSNYKTFLIVAQGFEDTGVAAYKGQATKIKSSYKGSDEILTSALQIHSTEARHAAHIRFVRLISGFATIKPWIIGNDNTKGQPSEPIYREEDDHRHVFININNIGGYKTGNAGTASFDEPLKKGEVLKIVAPFFA